ncbi:MAG: DinB family protein [Candidatus Acidiferrales bacterium]
MGEAERIADQLRRAYEGEAWHGPAVREALAGVTAAQAARRPLREAHTIWEIVLHIATWESVVRRRLEGEEIGELSPEQDWPPVRDTSEAAWKKTLADLEKGNQQLRDVMAGLTDSRLEEKVPVKGYSVYYMSHGVIQHDLYHAGQMALLKKAAM